MQGFFSQSEMTVKSKLSFSPKCGACGLSKGCLSPKMKYSGKGEKKILIIGEAPGAYEDEKGIQFIGKAGQKLKEELKRLGINMRRDCWITNAIRCRPPKNETPDTTKIDACRTLLFKEIEELQPVNILLFGATAAQAVLGYVWKEDSKFTMSKWTGWNIPSQKPNCWISVNYQPSYLNRKNSDLSELLFRENLKSALKNREYPWGGVPDYSKEIEIVYKSNMICSLLKSIQNGIIAFDYETNCIKPETLGAQIHSCAISNGKRTFAFPWSDSIIESFLEVMKNPNVKKIAGNIKFEERWTWGLYKTRVKGWLWDTILAAHVLNNATGITSVKFQSFVRLGLPPYNEHLEAYLEAPKGKKLNRIREINTEDLLTYNGIDSLVEYKIAKLQKKEMDSWDRRLK